MADVVGARLGCANIGGRFAGSSSLLAALKSVVNLDIKVVTGGPWKSRRTWILEKSNIFAGSARGFVKAIAAFLTVSGDCALTLLGMRVCASSPAIGRTISYSERLTRTGENPILKEEGGDLLFIQG
jgi:hypothetical protein